MATLASLGASSLGYRPFNNRNAGADIDETLFGGGGYRTQHARKGGNEILIVGKDTVQVRKRMDKLEKATARSGDAVVIPMSELNRLRENAKLLTKDEEMEQKRRAEEVYLERMQKSQIRKEQIRVMEEERRKQALLADNEKEGVARRNGVLERAKRMMDEDMDDVKNMNQMMLYSKVVTIRDAQIQEKRQVQAEREEEERCLDAMMEIERLKAVKMYEEREKERLQDQRRGAKVIVEQIKDRQAARMREEGTRDQERAFILKQMDSLKAEEVEQARQKKMAADRLMQEVKVANSAAMKIKEEKMMAEKLEEQKILEYREGKDQRERELEEEKERLAEERERETARMRARQERAMDKAGEMDALRAKRAVEASERVAREKDRTERQRQEAINQELGLARRQQQAEKERRLGEQAKFERDEFERIIEVQLTQEDAERQRQAEEKAMRVAHSTDLRKQIGAREEKALQERRDFLEEGNLVRASLGSERKHLEKIKSRKIEELKKAGVPEKYWVELQKKQIAV